MYDNNIVHILKETGYTKIKFAKVLKITRPTLDKNIAQFEANQKCNNLKLNMLFSRITISDHITKDTIDFEIYNTFLVIARIDEIIERFCIGKSVIEDSLETEKISNETHVESVIYEKNNTRKYRAGDIVECMVIEIMSRGIIVKFDDQTGFIHENYMHIPIDTSLKLGDIFNARIRSTSGNKYKLTTKGFN